MKYEQFVGRKIEQAMHFPKPALGRSRFSRF
jgi:hypothetical protein